MKKSAPEASAYGAGDSLACPQCGPPGGEGRLHVVRRSPDADDPGHELQILKCRLCGHEQRRSISKTGKTRD